MNQYCVDYYDSFDGCSRAVIVDADSKAGAIAEMKARYGADEDDITEIRRVRENGDWD